MATAENVWAWSTTAGSNDAADSSINWVEGQDPGTVNNSARSMMAATRKWANVNSGNVTVGGTADAIEITTGQSISSGHQALGFRICFMAGATNTGAVTVAVDGLSAVAIKRPNNDALSAGDIVSGAFHDIAFDGTNYRLLAATGAAGTYGALAGGNTWTGTNIFQSGATIGDADADVVVIKGTTVSSFGSQILSASSALAWRNTLGLGTAATANLGTSGNTVPLLNGVNTWDRLQSISGASATNSYLFGITATDKTASASWNSTVFFDGYPGICGIISHTAGVSPGFGGVTIYGTTSDARMKPEQDRRPIADSGAIIDALNPIYFKWGGQGDEDFGFVAQDVHAILPRAAVPGTGEPGQPGFVPWTMQHGRLEAILVAEIKALRARLAALEAG